MRRVDTKGAGVGEEVEDAFVFAVGGDKARVSRWSRKRPVSR